MRMLAGADFHGFKPAFEAFALEAEKRGVDLILVVGDLTDFGTIEEARDLLSILAKPDIPLFFVPGNCDPPSLINLNFNNVRCLHARVIIHGNLAFMGVGGSPITPFGTPFEMEEKEIGELLQNCLNGLGDEAGQHQIILISHPPPKNTKLDKTASGIHAGSLSVRRFIEKYNPLLAVCGHIHEARGKDRVGGTLVVNLGSAKWGSCAVINVDKRVDVNLQTLEV